MKKKIKDNTSNVFNCKMSQKEKKNGIAIGLEKNAFFSLCKYMYIYQLNWSVEIVPNTKNLKTDE